jgi:hypothetical protein
MADSKRGAAMIVVHHLNNSRSQRILWLLKVWACATLSGSRNYLLGTELSGADDELSFVRELAGRWADRSRYQTSKLGCTVPFAAGLPRLGRSRGGAYALAE